MLKERKVNIIAKGKWNRVHEFKKRKSGEYVGHPVYGKNKRAYKYLTFTHKPEEGKENDYHKLKHNIDSKEKDKPTYVKKTFGVNRYNDFDPPSKKYRIHKDDQAIIKRYKK